MIPENLQDRNVRRFKGFTPQQVEKLLAGKGFKPNSREAAEYLGAMAERAEEILREENIKAELEIIEQKRGNKRDEPFLKLD